MADSKAKKVSAIVSCYKGEKYLPAFLENCAEQSFGEFLEVVLVHNEPTEQEVKLVQSFISRYPGLINHIVVERENLAVSTNRAILAAKGEYVCVWNVDDLRTENSIELMAKTLDSNPEAGFTYGDFTVVKKWLATEGQLITCPEFEKIKFIRSMFTGPFYMWRKSFCEKIGYWDEQCLQGADFDYSSRLACETKGQKTHGLLGYYLDEGLGLSTKRATLQPIERTFIELRYGIYYKLDFWYYIRAKKYNINQVLENHHFINIDKLAPHRRQFMQSSWWMVYAIFRYPFWIAERVINKLIKILQH